MPSRRAARAARPRSRPLPCCSSGRMPCAVGVAHSSPPSLLAPIAAARGRRDCRSIAGAAFRRRRRPRLCRSCRSPATLGFYGAFLTEYDHRVMPALVGLERTAVVRTRRRGRASRSCPARATRRGRRRRAPRSPRPSPGSTPRGADLFGEFHETTWSPTLVCIPTVRRPRSGSRSGARGWRPRSPDLARRPRASRGASAATTRGGFWLSLAAAFPAVALLAQLTGAVWFRRFVRSAGAVRPHRAP